MVYYNVLKSKKKFCSSIKANLRSPKGDLSLMGFTVKEILQATKGRLISGDSKAKVPSVCIDSRRLKRDELFIAIKGERFDGHDFIEEAIKKGARVIVASRFNQLSHYHNINLIGVVDTIDALAAIAHYHRKFFNIPIIAITGSNGKTTTKEMLAWVLEKKYRVLKNEGTQNNQIGVALTLLRLKPAHQLAVLEIGTNHFGEVKKLTQIIQPNLGVITNIGPTHLEFFGDLKGVLKEKFSLIKDLSPPAIAVLNKDDRFIRSNLKNAIFKKRIVFTFGKNGACDFKVSRINHKNTYLEFFINGQWKFELNTLGWYNIYNVLVAVTCGRIFGIDYPTLTKRLKIFKFPSGRLKIERYRRIEIIDDTYNSNPLSLEYALDVLSNYPAKGRKVVVIGDMLELGKREEEFHYSIGKKISSSYIDILVTVGRLTNITAKAASEAGMDKSRIFNCKTTIEAARLLSDKLRPLDTLLIKGSHRMHMGEIIKILKENKKISLR